MFRVGDFYEMMGKDAGESIGDTGNNSDQTAQR